MQHTQWINRPSTRARLFWVVTTYTAFAAGASTHSSPPDELCHVYVTHDSCHTYLWVLSCMSHVTQCIWGGGLHAQLTTWCVMSRKRHKWIILQIYESCHTCGMWHTASAAGASSHSSPPNNSCHMNVTHEPCHISLSLVMHESYYTLRLPQGPPRQLLPDESCHVNVTN